MVKNIKILGFAGSLRKNSFNRALLRVAQGLIPQEVSLEIFDLDGIPLYNQEMEDNMPQIVKDFKNSIRNADALLIATPEYNRSIPGVLKNAIDWASRPPQDNAFAGKPVALIPYKCIHRHAGRRHGTIPSAPDFCFPQHVSD